MIKITLPIKEIREEELENPVFIEQLEKKLKRLFNKNFSDIEYDFQKEQYNIELTQIKIIPDETKYNTKCENTTKCTPSQNEQEIITIKEATSDYNNAYKDYKHDEEVYKVQLHEILKLPQEAEIRILQNKGIQIKKLENIPVKMMEKIKQISYNQYINLYNDGISLLIYLNEDYIIQ